MSSIKTVVQKFKVGRMARALDADVVDFGKQLKTPGRVLVLLPADRSRRNEIITGLDVLTELFPGCEIYLVSMPDDDVREAARREGFRCFSPHRAEIGWCGLPKKSFYSRVRNLKSRFAVDLDMRRSCFNAAISLASGAPLRVGMFGIWGAPIHNVEIKSKEPAGERKDFRQLLNVLKSLKMMAHK